MITTAVNKIAAIRGVQVVGVCGGTSGGKTFGILTVLIDLAIANAGLQTSVVGETMPHLRLGALRDFLNILKKTKRYKDANFNKTTSTYRFQNGSYIEFFSADNTDKAHGLRRDILYLVECNHISFEIYDQLYIRTRKRVYMCFNPKQEFWYHTEIQTDERLNKAELILTYKDNETLSETQINAIEGAKYKAYYDAEKPPTFDNIKSEYWHNWWQVYGLGLLGKALNLVLPEWDYIDAIPPEARFAGVGIDYGFSNDPAALVACYIWNQTYIFDEIIYSTFLFSKDLSKALQTYRTPTGQKITTDTLVIADSAAPQNTAELNNMGWRVNPVIKGADSVVFGLKTLQKQRFYVTKRSIHIVNELRQYVYKRNIDGSLSSTPVDRHNHAIDAMRYITSTLVRY